jgi:subtilisin family serine protease
VAAAGNGSESPTTPWRFAAYPAALPHVLGVAALRQNGTVPDYSNRDALFVDIAAPGDRIFSTVPRNLVDSSDPLCAGQAYSNCGPLELRTAIGTSFAAPQVAAAAALLLGTRPALTPMEVEWLLERSAQDVTSGNGCAACPAGRDTLTGWGRLDVAAAVADLANGTRILGPDADEPNDDAGSHAHPSAGCGRSPRPLTSGTTRSTSIRSTSRKASSSLRAFPD